MVDNIWFIVGWFFVLFVLFAIWYTVGTKEGLFPPYQETLAYKVQKRGGGDWVLFPDNYLYKKEQYWIWPSVLRLVGRVSGNKVYVYKQEYIFEVERLLPTLTPVLDADYEGIKQ